MSLSKFELQQGSHSSQLAAGLASDIKKAKRGEIVINYLDSIRQEKTIEVFRSLKQAGLIPLVIVVATLSAVVNIYVGDLALSPLSLERWQCIGIVVFLFIG